MVNFPIEYLGLPLGATPRKKDFWGPIIKKISKRLDGWKKKSFFPWEVESLLSNLAQEIFPLTFFPFAGPRSLL